MRLLALIAVAAAALLASSIGHTRTNSDSARPSVRITHFSPLVVAGDNFRSAERITIRVTAPTKTVARLARVSQRGRFVARFTAITGDRCSGGVSVVVTTADGRVAKTRMPQFLCPPAIP
jgi:hypothetical protein